MECQTASSAIPLYLLTIRIVYRYCPVVTPFKAQTEEINFEAFRTQVVRLASSGMGIVLLGTNGEGVMDSAGNEQFD
jgi:hypothetical protein